MRKSTLALSISCALLLGSCSKSDESAKFVAAGKAAAEASYIKSYSDQPTVAGKLKVVTFLLSGVGAEGAIPRSIGLKLLDQLINENPAAGSADDVRAAAKETADGLAKLSDTRAKELATRLTAWAPAPMALQQTPSPTAAPPSPTQALIQIRQRFPAADAEINGALASGMMLDKMPAILKELEGGKNITEILPAFESAFARKRRTAKTSSAKQIAAATAGMPQKLSDEAMQKAGTKCPQLASLVKGMGKPQQSDESTEDYKERTARLEEIRADWTKYRCTDWTYMKEHYLTPAEMKIADAKCPAISEQWMKGQDSEQWLMGPGVEVGKASAEYKCAKWTQSRLLYYRGAR